MSNHKEMDLKEQEDSFWQELSQTLARKTNQGVQDDMEKLFCYETLDDGPEELMQGSGQTANTQQRPNGNWDVTEPGISGRTGSGRCMPDSGWGVTDPLIGGQTGNHFHSSWDMVQPGASGQKDSSSVRNSRSMNEDILCKICWMARIDRIILPCKHNIVCGRCVDKLFHCPICMTKIKALVIAHKPSVQTPL